MDLTSTLPAPSVSASGYRPEYAFQVMPLARRGWTDFELANFFDVSVRTFRRWVATYADFAAALEYGKDEADDRVERSLYARAVGYTFESEKLFCIEGDIVRAPTNEHVPPDVGAATFWLKNRRPQEWREKQVVEHSNPQVEEARELSKTMSPQDAAALWERTLKDITPRNASNGASRPSAVEPAAG